MKKNKRHSEGVTYIPNKINKLIIVLLKRDGASPHLNHLYVSSTVDVSDKNKTLWSEVIHFSRAVVISWSIDVKVDSIKCVTHLGNKHVLY